MCSSLEHHPSTVWLGIVRIESNHTENPKYPSKSAKRKAKQLRRANRKRNS